MFAMFQKPAGYQELDNESDSQVIADPTTSSDFKHRFITTMILVLSFLVSVTVSHLDVVLAFVGSTGSTIVSFIIPGICFWKLHENSPWTFEKIASVCLCTYGIAVMIVCLTSNIVKLLL